MNNELMIFEGQELEILTKEEVNFNFDGTVLFNGKQVGEILGYKNPSESIRVNVREKDKNLVKNANVLDSIKHGFRKLNNAGEIFITEKGVMKLIINSNMPKAEQFEDKVWDIVTKVQQTGRFDTVENKLLQIQDSKERELSLGLYQLEQVLKVNPNDMLTTLAYNNMKQELTTYKQNKKLEEFENKVQAIEESQIEQKNRLNGLFTIGDRVQFVNEVNRIVRAYGIEQAEVYQQSYRNLKSLYGIDLCTRVKNRKEQIQSERLTNGKKPYAPSTLKSKVNNLTLADELEIWNELGRSLNAVEEKLIKQTK